MSTYILAEAEESDGDEEEYNEGEKKRLKKMKRVASDSSEEEEEDDEDRLREENKDFINDDIEEEEEEDGGSDSEVEIKRKRLSDDEDNLDDDDLDLIEENMGVKIDRKKKFKRVKRIEDEDSDAEDGDPRSQAERETFAGSGDEDEGEGDTPSKPTQQDEYGSEDEGEDSDTGSFIVDEKERPIQKPKKKPMFEDAGLEAARDIFGCDFDYGEFEQYDDWEERDEDDEDDDYEDEEEGEREVKRTQKEKRKIVKKTIYDVFEPSELERSHLTDQDHEIRKIDIPERFQLRQIPVTPTRAEGDDRAKDRELEEEAKWIYHYAFYKPYISNQEGCEETRNRSKRDHRVIHKIYNSLDLIRNSTCEVPFIAFYRKEEVQPELNIHDLWKIYKWDEKYCQLKTRKGNLKSLYQKMAEYQTALVMQNMDAPLPEDYRMIKDEEIEKIDEIETSEQLSDYYKHFLLYYGKDQEDMKDYFKKKEMQKPKKTIIKTVKVKRKIKRKKKKKANIDEDDDEDEELKILEEKQKDEIEGTVNGDLNQSGGNTPPPKPTEDEGATAPHTEEGRTTQEKEPGEAPDDEDEEETEVEVETEVEEKVSDDEGPEEEAEGLKKAIRRHEYELLRKAGIACLARKFGLAPEQFGENLRDNYQRYEVDQHPEDPSKEAESFLSKMCESPERVLEATVRMVGWQIASEPLVRSTLRETYFERARISIRPTKKGVKLIDESHDLFSLKYVTDKPVSDLQGDQFLKIKAGVEEKMITSSLSDGMEGNSSSNFLEEMKQLYYRDEFSQVVQDWNDLRGRAVEFAMTKVIADLKRELTQRLLTEAKEHVLEMCCRKLYNWLKIAPYNPGDFSDEDEDDWDATKGFRVFAIAYEPDLSQAAFGCCIDIDGDCCEFIRLPHLLKRKNAYNERDVMAKESDIARMKEFITRRKPHCVAVGAESREALMIVEDVKDILKDLEEQEQFPRINVELLENELSKVYSQSKKSKSDFLDYPPLLRQAISLGRRLQDPLIEFSQLCNADDEILNLKFHPLQYHLTPNELYEALCAEFVNRTNEVGVDLNMAVTYSYAQNLVQFVCGLGPRKANALIKSMKQSNSRLENRNQLVVNYHMGPKVFINCAGFIKIDTNALGDSDNYIEVLDSTRIHSEAYDWARKMAVDALEYEDEEGKPAEALEEILESPERLSELDLEAFATELYNQGFGKKSNTLYDIRHELNHRYKDFRQAYRSPSPEEIFNMLTKESPETFYIGKLVQVVVIDFSHRKPRGEQLDNANPVRKEDTGLWQCPFCLKNDFPELSEVWNHFDAEDCPGQAIGIRVRLDNGISGFINIKNLSDKPVTNPSERVKRNRLIHCRIIKIDPEKFTVELTSRTSDLQDVDNKWKPSRDRYYDFESEDKEMNSEKKKLEKKKTQYHKRVISHSNFRNIDYNEAEKLLRTMEQGDAIIRPSSKGVDHLTVSWKVTNKVYQHIDVKEQDKQNDFSLGQKLWIGNEEFEDLDEILARFVSPIAANVRQILEYKYYREFDVGDDDLSSVNNSKYLNKTKELVSEVLKEEKKKNPKNIPYIFAPVRMLPGKFLLSYLPRVKVIHEFVSVMPEGFRIRTKHTFSSLANLLRWFKMNFRTKAVGTGTPGAMTNRTPYMGGTTPNIDSAAVHKVAQNMPPHMLHNLSSAAASTPHFGTPYSQGYSNYATTPYTPSGQTPFMTPYATPGPSLTPRYGSHTPSHAPQYPSISHQANSTPSFSNSMGRHAPSTPRGDMDWQKAAAAWAQSQSGPRRGNRTPRQEDGARSTPRYSANPSYEDRRPRHNFAAPNATPRSVRSTPKSVHSPSSMSIGGDQTPLYDE